MPCLTTEYLFCEIPATPFFTSFANVQTKFSQRVSVLTEFSLCVGKTAEVQCYALFTLHGVETKGGTGKGTGTIGNSG